MNHPLAFSRPAAVFAGALVLAASLTVAGPLSPSAGPVASTFKTLTEIEPRTAINAANTPGDADSTYKITQPGSYYLTGNLQGASAKMGIEVVASNVTIDLNGFNMVGVPGSLTGINAYQMSRVTVRNGGLSSWGSRGIVIGAGGSVSDVAVDHCVSTGIEATTDCSITRCTCQSNFNAGIGVLRGSIVSACVTSNNNDAGIVTSGAAVVTGCTSTSNANAGIDAGRGTTVRDCTTNLNALDGITAADYCTITGNQAIDNGDDGIEIASYCSVSHNLCSGNDPAGDGGGVYTFNVGNRVEDNTLIGNRYGVNLAAGSDNFVARNSCRANTDQNFHIIGAQEVAPVITNPGSNGFAAMTPWSNVAY